VLAGSRTSERARGALGRLGDPLLALYGDPSGEVRRAAIDLLAVAAGPRSAGWRQTVAKAAGVAGAAGAAPDVRADAVALVALDRPETRIGLFERLLAPREPEAVQVEAVQALGRVPAGMSSASIGRMLLARWDAMTPAVRSAAADVLIADRARVDMLLDALRAGRVHAWTLDFWQKRDLVMHDDAQVRAAARALLEEDPRARAATIRRYAAALDLAGDAVKGRAVFGRVCAACHRLGSDPGGDLGPDLGTVRHRPPLALLGDILVPSQSIAQHYETYVVHRNGGRTEAGVLAAQTPDAITLRQGQGREVTIRRADIRSLGAAPQSSMPSDLDKVIDPAEMADLLAYIRGQ
jgi:putative heme-binding domain-containing protein